MNGQRMELPLDPLTKRELEILQLLADGLSDQEIGERFFLATGTVKWHIKNIYSKLGVHKRTAAVARARAFGLLHPADEQHRTPLVLPKHNLPYQTSTFIGRETDSANLLSLLADPKCRLMTLVGMGGIGKTRLAVHCAGQMVDSFQDGVCFVSLDSVPADLLPSALADALQLHVSGQGGLRNQLVHMLRYRRLLLLLDSFEHLIGEADFIALILEAASGLKLLVTSREVLNLTEEWVYPVEGLAIPSDVNSDHNDAFGAVALFMDRAAHIRRDFSASDELVWMSRICQLVGGMPLSIELLTTWLNILTCQEIAHELEHKLDLVASTRRDLPERHQNIRAVFEQSWELLTPEAQAVFQKMAVFRGSFSREAAQQVGGASLHTLISFVNKSLISIVKDHRYDLHPLLRQYAEEKLRQEPQIEYETRLLHSQYFAQSLPHTVMKVSRAQWYDAENVWSGFGYAIAQQDIVIIADYARGLWHHFEIEGWDLVDDSVLTLYQRGITLLESATVPQETVKTARTALSCLYECLGNALSAASRYDEARNMYEAALTRTEGENTIFQARLQRKIGTTYAAQRTVTDEAVTAYRAAEGVLGTPTTSSDPHWWHEWIEIQLDAAWAYYMKSDIEAVIRLADIAEPAVQRFGTPAQRSKFLHNRILIDYRRFIYRNLPDETLRMAEEALDAAREAGEQREFAWHQFAVGFTHLWRDEMDAAEPHFLNAIELARKVGDVNGIYVTILAYLPLIYRRRQEVEAVERWAAQGLDAALYANIPMYIGVAYAHGGWTCYRRNDIGEARTRCEMALNQWSQIGHPFPMQWMGHIPLLAIALHTSSAEQALVHVRFMLNPKQQQLLDPLPQLLSQAVHAWSEQQEDIALQHLHAFCEQSVPLGYL